MRRAGTALLGASLLAAAALAAYGRTFAVPFLFDDDLSIVKNPTLLHLWPLGRVLAPPPGAGVGGRPLLNLSFALNHAWTGFDPGSYHWVNLVVHILAAATLFGIVRRTMVGRTVPVSRGSAGTPRPTTLLAFAVALLWELDPIQTEAVTYVVGRAESLTGLFYLLTLYCFIRFSGSDADIARSERKVAGDLRAPANSIVGAAAAARRSAATSGRPLWAILSVAACFAGMATKEVMVTAPVMVLLYDRCFIAGSMAAAWRRRRGYYLALGSSWILLLALLPGLTGRGVGGAAGFPWSRQVLANIIDLGRYWRLAFWPHPLILDYGTVELHLPADSAAYFALASGLAALTVWALAARPRLGFLGAWFFIILLPTTSIIPLLEQPMADHRLYLAVAGPVALVAIAGRDLVSRLAGRSGDYLFMVLVVSTALLLGISTRERNDDYGSALSIWRDTVGKVPDNPRARRNLGSALLAENRFSEAAAEFQEELRLRPDAGTHYLLGTALARSGKWSEATAQYEQAISLNPDYAEAHSDLGIALVRQGRLAEASDHFNQALRLRPGSAEVHLNLGNIAFIQGRYSDAVAEYRAALGIDPNYAPAQKNLQLAEKASKH